MTSPDPLLTVEFGIPNACNRCHTDKDAAWALKTANEFHGQKLNRPTRARALILARARRGDPAARTDLIQLLKSETIPAWQAAMCNMLDRWAADPDATRALLDQLRNPSPLVREAAIRTLTHLVRQNREDVAKSLRPLLDDPLRSVRVAAAWALCATLDLNTRAGRELCHMLDLNADQPTGRMQLSQFAYLRGDSAAAIKQMRKAIAWDPNSPPFHHDLAILLSATGDNRGALQSLLEAVRLAPNEAEYHYKLALAWNEAGEVEKSAASLETTVRLDPANGRAWYNLGLARNALQQPQEAITCLLKGEAADPADSAIPYARATILARFGRREEAIAAATRALQLRQDFPEAIDLIRSLGR
jgi:tetratricopeptide (TPR) repeat protein